VLPIGPMAEQEKWSNKRWLNSGGSGLLLRACKRLRLFSGKYRRRPRGGWGARGDL